MRFRISADSFFQTNTAGAEVLYSTVRDYASLSPDSTVFDVYCGTGQHHTKCKLHTLKKRHLLCADIYYDVAGGEISKHETMRSGTSPIKALSLKSVLFCSSLSSVRTRIIKLLHGYSYTQHVYSYLALGTVFPKSFHV